jgi:septal ring factor EnvC (AmiA/AmiB activator)
MKNDTLYHKIDDVDQNSIILKALKSLEQKFEREISAKQDSIKWQQDELKRLQSEIQDKNNTISGLNTKLIECRSNAEGNRQLINKLISDIDRLQHNIDWYKRTYETRSLLGVIQDKLKHLFR